MNPATDSIEFSSDPIYRQNSMGALATDSLTDPSEKTCLIIFARITLWNHQSSQLQRYIGFRPVPTLVSYRITTLGIRMSFRGYDATRTSSVQQKLSKIRSYPKRSDGRIEPSGF